MNREKIIIRTSIIGILGNILLVTAKAIIGIFVHSIAIILDALNNLTDAMSSTITIIGTKLANKRPDKKHPFGHGRVEYITSAIIAIIILVAGGVAIYESVVTIVNNDKPDHSYISIIIVSIAIVAKILLGMYFLRMGKKVNSEALKASGKDALFDAALSLGTLVSIIVFIVSGVVIEGYVGIIIGIFILKGGFEIMRDSLSLIIGKRASKETVQGVKEIVLSFEEVKGAYDLIINDYGVDRSTGSIHIEVDDNLTAKEIHPLTRKISEAIYLKYHIIMTVGIYASNTYDEKITKIRKDINEILKGYPQVTQMHGFYVDHERMTISFDIIISFDEKNPNEIRNQILEKVSSKNPEYNYYIVLDKDISD